MVKCECGKDFKNNQGLSLHKRLHCEKAGGNENTTEKNGCDEGHSWRLLSRRIEREGKALHLGYIKICTECEEIE
jgi:hypothetical protein